MLDVSCPFCYYGIDNPETRRIEMDYKEVFQMYYDEAIEELGMDEDAAGKYANDMLYDHYASIADCMREERKYA